MVGNGPGEALFCTALAIIRGRTKACRSQRRPLADVGRTAGASASLHVRRSRDDDRDPRRRSDPPDGDRHLPGDQHPRRRSRMGLGNVQGAQVPLPTAGKQREIVVDLDTAKLYAWDLAASDISTAVNAQNLVLPSGTVKIGAQEYPVLVNASPSIVDEFNHPL